MRHANHQTQALDINADHPLAALGLLRLPRLLLVTAGMGFHWYLICINFHAEAAHQERKVTNYAL